MQPEFTRPEFIENNTAEEIHERMMNNLPPDIDDMPGGFPYDFTKPAALEKDEFINYHLVRALMIAFPQYAWDEWLDLHGQQVHLERHQPEKAYGKIKVVGTAGTELVAGVIFCTPATETGPAIEYKAAEDAVIGEDGTVLIPVEAVESGTSSNVAANTVVLMARPDKNITEVSNPEPITGGTERESNDDYYDRIAAEYENSMTYLGNDSDYARWAKQAGAGDCIVVSVAEGPGTVKLVLVDGNGQPANEKLVQDVYDYIVSPGDRSKRLLPTACSRLICEPATTVRVDFTITGLVYDDTTGIEQIKEDFTKAVKAVYSEAKKEGVLRYNDVRPIISDIAGVEDFDTFLMGGDMKNLRLSNEEYPETGTLNFS
ncbi:MAG: baseplate J/gp47 family protein [Butyrivibrio sp.]|nr:baseplate J/gp47 family protein [Butyrivibrio sp.]